MIRSACTSTLREKVYNAKLEVFISAPRIYTTQAGSSSRPCFFPAGPGEVAFEVGFGVCQLALQGVTLSLRRTPLSRANCSNVMGRKEAKGIVSCHQRHRERDKLPRTHCTDCKGLRCPSIAVPSCQLFPARRTGVFSFVLRLGRILHLASIHVPAWAVDGRTLVVSLDGGSWRNQRRFCRRLLA